MHLDGTLKHVLIYFLQARRLWPAATIHAGFFGPWRSKEKWHEGKRGPCAQQISPQTLGIYNYSLFAGKRRQSNLHTWHSPCGAENPSAQRHSAQRPSASTCCRGCLHPKYVACFSAFLPFSLLPSLLVSFLPSTSFR